MSDSAVPSLSESIERLYGLFGAYPRPLNVAFCTHCYDPDDIAELRDTPLRDLDPELARLLTWEASDHFETTEIYKHYLPRILEFLAPPSRGEDIFPEHLFETMEVHGFRDWPVDEQKAFWAYAAAVDQALKEIDPRAARIWEIASTKLNGSPFRPYDPASEDPRL